MKIAKIRPAAIQRMTWLLIALVALVTADGVISHFLIEGGYGREWNPFLQTLVGEEYFLIIKLAGALLCAFILWDIYKRWPKLALISTSCMVAVYSGMALWNLHLFFTV